MRSKRCAFKTKETLSWLVLVFLLLLFFFLGELKHSSILENNLKFLRNWLKPVAQSKSSRWMRCWRASVEGWAASTFHSRCDNKGPTVTIIRVGGKYIFGGYTSLSWGKWFGEEVASAYQVITKLKKKVICCSTCCIPLHAATATECDKTTKGGCRLLKFWIHCTR